MKRRPFFLVLAVLAAMFLLYSADNSGSKLREYVCRINVSYHPNMDGLLRGLAESIFRDQDDPTIKEVATYFSALRMGSSGTGFVYVDKNGVNYIITNYHVVANASNFSATFEKAKGEPDIYRGLTVFSIDIENDLAMLVFRSDQKPPLKKGLPFYSKSPNELAVVLAAGFPGLGGIAQFNPTMGNITNLNGKVKISNDSDLTRGPYYLHSAQIDPGNSGGPLLIADSHSPADYSVVGVNVMKFTQSSSGSIAIPLDVVQKFVLSSIEKSKRTDIQILNQQLDDFVKFLNKKDMNKTKMSEDFGLMPFLSTIMVNANITSALQSFLETLPDDLGMKLLFNDSINTIIYSAAYDKIIKPLMNFGTLNIEAVAREPNNFGGFTVLLLINGNMFRTEWVKEGGTFRMSDFYQDNGKLNHLQIYATYFPLGKTVHYSFISRSDVAWYRVKVEKAGNLKAETALNLATQIRLIDSTGKELIRGDSGSGKNRNALINQRVDAGTYYLEVKQPDRNAARSGYYDLTIRVE